MLQTYSTLIEKSIKFIPGSGAGNLKELISIAIASSEKYLVLLDSDEAGITALKKYKHFFGVEEAKNIFTYETPYDNENVTLEKLLSEPDAVKLKGLTEAVDTKGAIISLFHCRDTEKIKCFIEVIDAQTKDNLSKIITRINSLILTNLGSEIVN